jgi:hypothetical protein
MHADPRVSESASLHPFHCSFLIVAVENGKFPDTRQLLAELFYSVEISLIGSVLDSYKVETRGVRYPSPGSQSPLEVTRSADYANCSFITQFRSSSGHTTTD